MKYFQKHQAWPQADGGYIWITDSQALGRFWRQFYRSSWKPQLQFEANWVFADFTYNPQEWETFYQTLPFFDSFRVWEAHWSQMPGDWSSSVLNLWRGPKSPCFRLCVVVETVKKEDLPPWDNLPSVCVVVLPSRDHPSQVFWLQWWLRQHQVPLTSQDLIYQLWDRLPDLDQAWNVLWFWRLWFERFKKPIDENLLEMGAYFTSQKLAFEVIETWWQKKELQALALWEALEAPYLMQVLFHKNLSGMSRLKAFGNSPGVPLWLRQKWERWLHELKPRELLNMWETLTQSEWQQKTQNFKFSDVLQNELFNRVLETKIQNNHSKT